MHNQSVWKVIGAVAAVATASCGAQGQAQLADEQTGRQEDGLGIVHLGDLGFLNVVAGSSNAQVQMANLAVQRSPSPLVREYAAWIAQYASDLEQQAVELGARKGASVSSNLSVRDKYHLARLQNKFGSVFDSKYLSYEQAESERGLRVADDGFESSVDPDIGQLAVQLQNELPAILQLVHTIEAYIGTANDVPGQFAGLLAQTRLGNNAGGKEGPAQQKTLPFDMYTTGTPISQGKTVPAQVPQQGPSQYPAPQGKYPAPQGKAPGQYPSPTQTPTQGPAQYPAPQGKVPTQYPAPAQVPQQGKVPAQYPAPAQVPQQGKVPAQYPAPAGKVPGQYPAPMPGQPVPGKTPVPADQPAPAPGQPLPGETPSGQPTPAPGATPNPAGQPTPVPAGSGEQPAETPAGQPTPVPAGSGEQPTETPAGQPTPAPAENPAPAYW